jgi:hypothetical protein
MFVRPWGGYAGNLIVERLWKMGGWELSEPDGDEDAYSFLNIQERMSTKTAKSNDKMWAAMRKNEAKRSRAGGIFVEKVYKKKLEFKDKERKVYKLPPTDV